MSRIPYKNLMQSDEMAEKLEMSTAEIGLSVRTTNCLEERGIFTVHDLLNCTQADLLSISNFGEKTLEEVYKALEKIGFFRSTRPAGDAADKRPEPVSHAS
jgi:DNA-directed RNA polymerase subunit alpha